MVKVISELPLRQFKFWSGAEQVATDIADGNWEILEQYIYDMYPDGIDATCLNDLFWFESDSLAEWLGYSSWEDYLLRDKKEGDG